MISDKVFDGVLELVLHSSCDTREKIAKELGYSAATVGKAVNWLLDAGVLEQRMVRGAHAGRKTGILSLAPNAGVGVINIMSRRIEFSYFDVNLGLERYILEEIDSDLTHGDALRRLLNTVRLEYGIEYGRPTFPIGIILPPPDRNEASIRDDLGSVSPECASTVFHEVLGFGAASVISSDEAQKISLKKFKRFSKDKRVFYLGFSDMISSFLLENGHFVEGIDAACAVFSDGQLRTSLYEEKRYENATEKIARVLSSVMLLCAPDLVVIEGRSLRISDDVYDMALELSLPTVPKSRLILNTLRPFADDIGMALYLRDACIVRRIEQIKRRREEKNYNFDY